MGEVEESGGRGGLGLGVGRERKQHSIAKRPTDTKGRRMTGTRVKPARRNEEEGDGRDGWRGGWEGRESQIQTRSLATDSISSLWLCGGGLKYGSSPG